MSKMGLSMNLDCCSIKTQTAAANYLWISTLTSVHHSQRASKLFFFCTFVGLPTIKIQNKTKNAAANSGQDKLQFELFKPQNVSLGKNLGLRFLFFFYLSAASENIKKIYQTSKMSAAAFYTDCSCVFLSGLLLRNLPESDLRNCRANSKIVTSKMNFWWGIYTKSPPYFTEPTCI